jgi:NAD(P)H dehydrogenase (quinone)
VWHGQTCTPISLWTICSRRPLLSAEVLLVHGRAAGRLVAPEDIATVAARILTDGPDRHGGKQYWLATEILNGTQAAAEITKGLDIPVEALVLTPDDLLAQVASGGMKMPAYVEATYAASILEWVQQTYEGRLNFVKVTSVVEDLTGNKPQTLETWVRANREAVLAAAS